MTFGEKLKEARKQKGLKQTELASMIGVAKTTLANYEIGNREPDLSKIKKIVEVLQVTPEFLLDIEVPPEEETFQQSLMRLSRLLNEEGKTKLLAYAEDLSNIENYQSRKIFKVATRNGFLKIDTDTAKKIMEAAQEISNQVDN